MAQTAASEKAGAGGSSSALRAPAAPDRLLSPGGYLAVAVGLVITIVIVLRATAAFQDSGGPAPVHDGYDEVDLGQVNWDLAPEAGGLVREPFMLRVVVVLNPKVRDMAALRQQVERRRNLFRDIVWSEIVNSKSDAELRKPAVLEAMKMEIRQRLNVELGGPKDGQEMIDRVIFPDRKLPERR
ncbi:MAG TPA: flagellar basal body-associated FliL family protein [Planctomycetota bacterium]|nr:flagellar basal body-associated FliL family protein [Planctomycetota bacterium]